MTPDFDSFLDEEVDSAPKTLTNSLFHYTAPETAIFGILTSATLRLSPFDSTNDLWESRPSYVHFQSHEDQAADGGDRTDFMPLWSDIDNRIRRNSKVACLTQDFSLPSYVMNPNSLRGWNHLSMWAHYGAGHRGICLRFDKEMLVAELEKSASAEARVLHGPVVYRSASTSPTADAIDIGQLREFGIDAVAQVHALKNREALFLRKHRDWSSELEYRLVRTDRSALPFALPISHSLTGIFLGESFPDALLPALHEALDAYSNVEVFGLSFHQRNLNYWPVKKFPTSHDSENPLIAPKREGTLAQRVTALIAAEDLAGTLRDRGARLVSGLGDQIDSDIHRLTENVPARPDVEVTTQSSISAIPTRQRGREAGVPGERVHYERGVSLVANSKANSARYLTCSSALQVLDEENLRMHAVIVLENLEDSPNHQTELWRESKEVPNALAASTWNQQLPLLISKFQNQWDRF